MRTYARCHAARYYCLSLSTAIIAASRRHYAIAAMLPMLLACRFSHAYFSYFSPFSCRRHRRAIEYRITTLMPLLLAMLCAMLLKLAMR